MLRTATSKCSHILGINLRQLQSAERGTRDIHQRNYLLCANCSTSPRSGQEARAGTGLMPPEEVGTHLLWGLMEQPKGDELRGEQGLVAEFAVGAEDGTALLSLPHA